MSEPIGVVLAGGRGRRIGGDKATVELSGRPLIAYPLDALAGALSDVAVIVKADNRLPDLPGVTVWIEPPGTRHPLTGIVGALALAGGRPVLVCATDLPFVTSHLVARLAATDPRGAPAVIAVHGEQLQPLLGCYQPWALPLLEEMTARRPTISLREAVAAIAPRRLEVGEPRLLFNVNAPEDVLQAAAMLDRTGRYPNVKA